mmetsp:Transcript_4734/g.13223  ORF Transcript_4734/g.13223 Transcript_4734/m.13223 type:complete len:251 (+) Transcript_4734:749-1501(+)
MKVNGITRPPREEGQRAVGWFGAMTKPSIRVIRKVLRRTIFKRDANCGIPPLPRYSLVGKNKPCSLPGLWTTRFTCWPRTVAKFPSCANAIRPSCRARRPKMASTSLPATIVRPFIVLIKPANDFGNWPPRVARPIPCNTTTIKCTLSRPMVCWPVWTPPKRPFKMPNKARFPQPRSSRRTRPPSPRRPIRPLNPSRRRPPAKMVVWWSPACQKGASFVFGRKMTSTMPRGMCNFPRISVKPAPNFWWTN